MSCTGRPVRRRSHHSTARLPARACHGQEARAPSAPVAAPAGRLVSITSNEPDDGLGDGDTAGDVQGADFGQDDRTFMLRAERSGGGNGRAYTITYVAEDASGNETSKQATVTVPKSRSGQS